MTWDPKPPRIHATCTPQDTRGPKRLWDAPAGFVVRERGDVDGLVTHDYLCPVHGRFERKVPRSWVPDELPCPLDSWSIAGRDEEYADLAAAEEACSGFGIDLSEVRFETQSCAATSPWSPGAVACRKSSGEVTG